MTADQSTDAELDEQSADAGPAPFSCSYCSREFARADYRDLHRGLDHPEAITSTERQAYETAREAEEEALTLFRYKALALLIVIYFGFLILYAVSL